MPQSPDHPVPVRKLAAIMFTDIEGYTALMQEDENKAILLRNRHRQIFQDAIEKYQGEILQYYGDGTLSIFDSAIAAVHCGIEMQRAFQNGDNPEEGAMLVPVRIGIHLGDIIYSSEDIVGDSVNLASRVESMAVAGSVFISAKVFDEIKNQATIETRSMGRFELKNVAKPIEVYALTNAGLVVPDPARIQGKAKRLENSGGGLWKFWDYGYVQLTTGYLAGIWGLIEFLEWLLKRYQISPHWTDVLLVFFLSLIPSLLFYVWKSEHIKRGKIGILEKIAFPGNLTLSALLLVILFKGTDLGATTQTVTFKNEEGVEQFSTIIKPGFRKKLAIFNFNPKGKDSIHHWLNRGIHTGIAEDITQNGYITIGFWGQVSSLQEMLNEAKEDFYPYCLTGTYSVEDGLYQITTKLYKTQSGSLKISHTFKGRDFFALLDTITLSIKKDLGFSQKQIDQFVDLPFSEAFTSDLEAYQNFSLFLGSNQIKYLEEAINLDSTFTLAHYVMAAHLYGWSFSKIGAKDAIDKAMRHRQRLPESWKSNVKQLYFQINDQPEKAIALLKMQLELNPGDQNLLTTLTQYLYLTNQFEELLALRNKLALIDPSPGRQIDIAEALFLNEQISEAEQVLQKVLKQYPNQTGAVASMISFYALDGQFEKVDALVKKLILINPEIEPLVEQYNKAFQYARSHTQTQEELKKYTGLYRLENWPAKFDVSIIKNILFIKGKNQSRGYFTIPREPDKFTLGNIDFLEEWHFIGDSSGGICKVEVFGMRLDGSYKSVLWRQDSLIQKAMGLFSFGKKAEALEAFRQAYHKNPQHFYLAEYVKHLEFVLDPVNKSVLENMKRYAGKYGPRNIWLEGDKFYYSRKDIVSKQQLLPIAPGRFYFEGGFLFQMEIVLENNEVKGTVSWQYNPETGRFERDDEDFFALDKLKD